MTIIGQDRVVLWFQPSGPGTAFIPFGVGETAGGMSGKTVPGPGRTPVYGRTEFGAPVVIKVNREAPGDLPNATITIYERAQIDILLDALQRGCPINIQTRIVKCGSLNNPNGWDVLDHWGQGEVTSYNPGDAPTTEFSGEAVTIEGSVSFTHYIRLLNLGLSDLTVAATEDMLSIAGMPDEDCNLCGNGYPGADQIQYYGAAAGAGDGVVYYTRNGGGSILATSADPWTVSGNSEDITFIQFRPISQTQLRIVVGTGTTVVGVKTQFAYADVTYGAEGTVTWTQGTIAATTTADYVEAMFWPVLDRLYFASAGDIYLSNTQATTDPGAAIYTGAVAFTGFAASPDKSVIWGFGATNLIVREVDQSGSFETRVGPSGGGAFASLTVAGDGTIFAGNGTSIYKNTDNANNAGNWTQLNDFGANQSVVAIQAIGGQRALGGDSQLLRAVVDDTTGAAAAHVWESVDGGASWRQIQELTNLGYNQAYFSEIDDNLGFVVGDASGGASIIQKLSPV